MVAGPLWFPGLKQAVAVAIAREVLVDRVFEGSNTPAHHMVPDGYRYATEPMPEGKSRIRSIR